MRLYYSDPSPFARKVRVALIEAGLHEGVEQIPVVNTPIAPHADVAGVNPLGKIPCLITEEGVALYDSRVITRYIATRAPLANLYPEGNDLWEALSLEALADGVLEAAVLCVYETRLRPVELQSADWQESQWLKITRALDDLEENWIAYLEEHSTMPVLAIAVALGYLDLRFPDRDWRESRPQLAQWENRFRMRPSISDTIPEG